MTFRSIRWAILVAILPAAAAAAAAGNGLTASVERFTADYVPWEPDSRVTASANPAEDLTGFHAYQIQRKGKYDKLDLKLTEYVSADGDWIFTGIVVRNSQAQDKTATIHTDRDVEGVADYFAQLFRAKAHSKLDPANDRAGLKAVLVTLNTGFFDEPVHVYVEPDGSALLIGQLWKLHESPVAQRLAILDTAGSPAEGAANPEVTAIEFADMECPFCKKRGIEMDRLMEKYGQKLKIRRVYKYFPLWANHAWSMKAASAAVCLSRTNPDLVFRFKSQCYQSQETLTVAGIDQLAFDFADAAGIPRSAFIGCYLQPASFAPIIRDMEEGGRVGVISTPTYFLNGVEIYWLPDDVMEDYLKSLLAASKKK
jgi:protein-disulfide isomerase